MSMAEDTRKRPDFSSDFPSNSPRESGNDPLAELARLIGQSDPFTDGAKRAGARKPSDFSAGDRPAPEWLARPAASEHDDYEAPPAPRAAYVPPAQDHYDEPVEETRAYRPASGFAEEGHDRYTPPPSHDAHAYDAHATQARDAAHYPADDTYENDGRYGVARPTGDYETDDYDGGHLPPQGDDGVLPARKRGGMLTIAAVLGLAVVGTAGAFGYRAFTSPGSGGSSNPPVIKADTTPAKTVPAAPAPAQSADSSKPFQDRIGAPGPAATKLGPTEEQPVSLPVPPPASRATTPLPSAASAAPLVMPPPPTSAANEPKRVKTMTIRQDGGAGGIDSGTTASMPTSVAPAARAPVATKQSGAAPMAIAPSSSTPPQSNTKVAARTPAAPARGSYMVQVSAQKSEAEAQSSYRALQQKYPTVLGSREPTVSRAELGQAGTWYRVQVGAFSTSEQATAFCNSLKDAGGQCIVQRN